MLSLAPQSFAFAQGPATPEASGGLQATAQAQQATAQAAEASTSSGFSESDPETLPDPIRDGLVSADAVAAVARSLNCPLCEGYNLQDCPLTVCAQMRAQIARDLAAGSSAEAIKASFVADYGTGVLNAPPTEGYFWIVWLAPFLALLAGGLWLLRSGRRIARIREESGSAPSIASRVAPDASDPRTRLAERFAAMADEPPDPER